MRNRFGKKFNHLETKIDGPQKRVGTKRRGGQFMQPSANAFDFDVIEQTNKQYRYRHAQGGGQIGRGNDAEIMDAVVNASPLEHFVK